VNVPLLDLVAQYASIKDEVIPALMRVVERQQFILGEEVSRLEEALAQDCGVSQAIACASGTDALLLPLRTLDLKPGDEVICPAFTFFATAGTVYNTGGTPVFVDIDPKSFNLSPAAVEASITARTRAIIVVHLFGQMADLGAIKAIADRHGIPVIEDAAQSIGARRLIDGEWRIAGSVGYAGSFSFFPSKNLGAWGDAGMMTTQDQALGDRLRRLRTHGGMRQYLHEEVGYNSRLDTLQAAVLLVKLPHLAGWSAARLQRAAYYSKAFAEHTAITTPYIDPANEHIFHQYTIQVSRRDELVAHLKARGIGCAVYYPLALHLQPCFAYLGYAVGQLPVTERATASVVSLPIYPELTTAQQDAVVDAVTSFFR
jgi:dTDP-4-amino-4,6-dideoxygalactose transaminase